MMRTLIVALFAALFASNSFAQTSAFFPPPLLERIRANAQASDWGKDLARQAIAAAEPWAKMSDQQLWRLMFGATLERSWHVLSNGDCPTCAKPVPMYDWQIDAIARPWKVRCPHCQELFPKNDFAAFYESGLDEHGIFNPSQADRKLLFNVSHPGAGDPLHSFGVDDGTGFARGEKRWRFIATYLVYGQWKQAVHLGIKRLATAYLLSGDATYAHKAAILLDRVADVYPTFDFKSQALLYESVRGDGYVSVWHDATIETRELTLAYDSIKPAIAADAELARFLATKSDKFQTPLRKRTPADISANIEQRILRDALANPHKIYSNYPQQFLTQAVIQTALDWPKNRAEVLKLLDPVIEQSNAVDGTTGEKGLAGYSSYAAQRLAEFLGYYTRMDERFLPEMVERHPRLPRMWRFFIDTWCADEKYYPLIGDTGWACGPVTSYAGVSFTKDHALSSIGHMGGVLAPSMYSFLWNLHEVTFDPAFVQVLVKSNDGKLDGLPHDLFVADPADTQRRIASVIEKHGPKLRLPSVNKEQWHLGILRSGNRAAWLDYDTGGGHGHLDGLNLGLFAHGLDLMPDLGYPPVQFGGWGSARATWYVSSMSHNTVIIDGAEQAQAAGRTTLWAAGEGFSAIAAAAPELYPGKATAFERTVALVDVSPDDSYLVDIFRVAGGGDHRKSFFSHFGEMETPLAMQPATDLPHPQMRNFRVARSAEEGWSTTLKVQDRYKLLPTGADVRVRYTDFTDRIDVYACESWAIAGIYNSNEEAWLPRLILRRQGPAPLASTFVSIIEPFDGKRGPLIQSSRRIALQSPTAVALEITLADGRRDLIVSNPSGESLVLETVKTDARLCTIRRDPAGHPVTLLISDGNTFTADAVELQLSAKKGFIQLQLGNDQIANLLRGDAKQIVKLLVGGKPYKVQPSR